MLRSGYIYTDDDRDSVAEKPGTPKQSNIEGKDFRLTVVTTFSSTVWKLETTSLGLSPQYGVVQETNIETHRSPAWPGFRGVETTKLGYLARTWWPTRIIASSSLALSCSPAQRRRGRQLRKYL